MAGFLFWTRPPRFPHCLNSGPHSRSPPWSSRHSLYGPDWQNTHRPSLDLPYQQSRQSRFYLVRETEKGWLLLYCGNWRRTTCGGKIVSLSQFLLLTSIDADKRALGHVIQTADAPAFVLGFEELETNLQAVLHQSVGAHLRTAFTPLITLVDPRRESKRQITASETRQISSYIQP